MKRAALPKSFRKYYGRWFDTLYYDRGIQPFTTFLRNNANKQVAIDLLKNFLAKPEEAIALEIGPGSDPLITLLPFKEHHFIEHSEKLARSIRSKQGHLVEIVDIRKHLFRIRRNLGVVVVNEVFSHIKPSERVEVLKKLAEVTQTLFIIDRMLVPLDEIKRRIELRVKATLANAATNADLIKKFPVVREYIAQEKGEIKVANQQKAHLDQIIRLERQNLVNFVGFSKYLEKRGWQVDIVNMGAYSILMAKTK